MDAPLRLPKGRQGVTLHVAPKATGEAFEVEVLAVELVRPSVRDAQHAEAMASPPGQ